MSVYYTPDHIRQYIEQADKISERIDINHSTFKGGFLHPVIKHRENPPFGRYEHEKL